MDSVPRRTGLRGAIVAVVVVVLIVVLDRQFDFFGKGRRLRSQRPPRPK